MITLNTSNVAQAKDRTELNRKQINRANESEQTKKESDFMENKNLANTEE